MSFSRSYQSLHSMSTLFGLLPFRIDRERTGQILGEHVTVLDLVRSSIITLICVASTIHSIFENDRNKLNLVHLDQATNAVHFEKRISDIVRYTLIISYVILDIINRKRFVDILKKFDTFDEEVICIFTLFDCAIWTDAILNTDLQVWDFGRSR